MDDFYIKLDENLSFVLDFHMIRKKIPLGMTNIVATDFNPLKKKLASGKSFVGTEHINNA